MITACNKLQYIYIIAGNLMIFGDFFIWPRVVKHVQYEIIMAYFYLSLYLIDNYYILASH